MVRILKYLLKNKSLLINTFRLFLYLKLLAFKSIFINPD